MTISLPHRPGLAFGLVGGLVGGLLLATACTQEPASTQTPPPAEETSAAEPASQAADNDKNVVNVYSARHYDNDLILFEQFNEETGIKINLIEGRGDALIERIASEGATSPADVFITADAGILWRAETRGLFAPTPDATLETAIAENSRHPEGKWYGLSKRARIIIYNKEAGLPEGLNDYEDLANDAYEGTICVRPSSSIYNQSLLASIIAHAGEQAAQEWAQGVVENFARPPEGNDTAQIKAVAAGICQLGIVNSYYVGRFVGDVEGDNKTIGEKIGVLFPNQDDRGAHVNISGGGVLVNAPHPDNAIKLLQFLTSTQVQASFASGNNEYPVRSDVPPTGNITALGPFKQDALPMTALGENQRLAVEIFDRVGWK